MRKNLKHVAVGATAFLAVGAASSGAAAFATVMFPSSNICHLSAGDPVTSSGTVGANTGRYHGTRAKCSNTTVVRGQLKRDIPWQGDPIDASGSKRGVTLTIRVSESCSNHGRGTYYTHVESDAGTQGDGTHKVNC